MTLLPAVPPIFRTFVFFDWHNTLSTAPLWDSIVSNKRHPLARRLTAALEDLFRGRKDVVGAWMRGQVTNEQVIESLNIKLPPGYKDDYLLRVLLRDCRNAKIHPAMADIVRALRDRVFLAVATDNMECFVHATPRALTDELRIDELLVSSSLGLFKQESPERFFGPTLDRYGLTPADAVLIDDCADTCQTFRAWGGSAYHYTEPGRLRADIAHLLPELTRVSTPVPARSAFR